MLALILDFFNSLAKPLVDVAKWLWNRLRSASPSARNWLIVIVVIAVAGCAYWFLNRKTEQGGGLDVTSYCKSFKFDVPHNVGDEDPDNKSCSSVLDLTAACRWEHEDELLKAEFESPDNTESARCVANGVDKGGIDDLTGYCQHHHGTDEAGAMVDSDWKDINRSWMCLIHLDLNAACAGQHNNDNMEARQNDNGLWICYR